MARLRLARSRRVGPATYRRLMAEHGDAAAALAALPRIAAQAGADDYEVHPERAARAEGRAARAVGARLLTLGDPDYPARLAEVADAPPVLWCIGDPARLAAPCVSVVGTRNASSLGLRMARALGRDLAEAGVTVVSGLARGVDAGAHAAALQAAARTGTGGTAAVHAGGLDRPYPPENVDLATRIAAESVALSERPFGLHPVARDFPRRNRIVSGLSRVVVVVEAAARSGSMITAGDALDQGREVAAVPGHPLDARASGCNLLLRDGATLVRGADDVLDVLEQAMRAAADDASAPAAAPPPAPPFEAVPAAALLDLLGEVPAEEDAVIAQLCDGGGAAAAQVSALISALELEGRLARRPGGGLVRL
ncbi:DNA-protecting protein DprA [Jannaschia sp. Os4]|uniref:DNA-processing protein DprA n=1 Tax=Jannaschia sp. Os4 TaxID=2807617 RepID=UPI0019397A1F|nr:DNA-processing protein DprA [Jannaschia sp. Os4]MBM2574950.1 DNA-protecting protein DprA [Jannaschia sp. Os4]